MPIPRSTALPRVHAVATTVFTVWRAIVTRLPVQRAITDPCRLDDRLLRDIGLTRADLMTAQRIGRPRKTTDP